MRYLRDIQFDQVKIDGEFVRNLPHSPADQLIVKAVADMATGFGAEVVGENVENRETAELLHSLGIDYGQGYFLGRPGPLSTWEPVDTMRRRGRLQATNGSGNGNEDEHVHGSGSSNGNGPAGEHGPTPPVAPPLPLHDPAPTHVVGYARFHGLRAEALHTAEPGASNGSGPSEPRPPVPEPPSPEPRPSAPEPPAPGEPIGPESSTLRPPTPAEVRDALAGAVHDLAMLPLAPVDLAARIIRRRLGGR